MEKEEKKKKRIFLKFIILLLLITTSTVLYARYLGTSGLVIKEYNSRSTILPKSFNGIKVIHFSDLYLNNNINKQSLEKLVNNINKVKPDIIIFGGGLSYNIKSFNDKNKELLIDYFSKIDCTLGSYYISSSEDKKNSSFDEIMSSSNFISLETPQKIFNKTIDYINIYSDKEEMYEESKYNVVVLRETNNIDNILKKENAPSVILGNGSLGGLVIIPYYGPVLLEDEYKSYYAPYYLVNNTEIYISSGIGTKNIKFRLFNKPSINFYRLTSV